MATVQHQSPAAWAAIHQDEIEQKLNYHFQSTNLLAQAFTHSSYANEKPDWRSNGELEHHGDTVLGYIVSRFLAERSPGMDQGTRTLISKHIVRNRACIKYTNTLNISQYLLFIEDQQASEKVKRTAKKRRDGNLFEAIVGAIDLDSNTERVQHFILGHFQEIFLQKASYTQPKLAPSKPALQPPKPAPVKVKQAIHPQPENPSDDFEGYCQSIGLKQVTFHEHDIEFSDQICVEVRIGNLAISTGLGTTTADAKSSATQSALTKLQRESLELPQDDVTNYRLSLHERCSPIKKTAVKYKLLTRKKIAPKIYAAIITQKGAVSAYFGRGASQKKARDAAAKVALEGYFRA